MRFSQLTKGTRAVKRVAFPMLDGTQVECAVRPLLGVEDVEVIAAARAFAMSHGVAEPTERDDLYQRGKWASTLLKGCVDPDAPDVAFFSSVEEILENLDVDRIALLVEQQQQWQDECSPRLSGMTHDEYVKSVVSIALAGVEEELPFSKWRPSLRESWARSTAALALSSLEPKSGSGKGSSPSSSTVGAPPQSS